MAVRKVGEIWEGRFGEGTEERERSYARVFQVFTDNQNDGATLVANAAGIPIVGQDFLDANGNVDGGARCKRVRAEQYQDDPKCWKVTCEYSSDKPDQTSRDPAKQVEDPILRPPEVSISFTQYKRVVDKDRNGDPILNSAGDGYDPPLEIDDNRLVIHYKDNIGVFDLNEAVRFTGAVNGDNFLTFQPGQCRIRSYTGESSFENDQSFWKRTIEIEVRREGFIFSILNAGFNVIDQATQKKKPAEDAGGQVYSSPVPLDAEGNAIGPADDPRAVYNTYELYDSDFFGTLGIEDGIQAALDGD